MAGGEGRNKGGGEGGEGGGKGGQERRRGWDYYDILFF